MTIVDGPGTVELRLRGPLETRVDGAAVPLPGPAERALLALLRKSRHVGSAAESTGGRRLMSPKVASHCARLIVGSAVKGRQHVPGARRPLRVVSIKQWSRSSWVPVELAAHWCHYLRAYRRVEVGEETVAVDAVELHGGERDAAWESIRAPRPSVREYKQLAFRLVRVSA